MPRKLNHAAAAWLLGICFILLGIPAFAEPPGVEEVLGRYISDARPPELLGNQSRVHPK